MRAEINRELINSSIKTSPNYLEIGILPSVSLNQRPKDAPMRFPVPDKFIFWENEFSNYNPTLLKPSVESARVAQERSLKKGFSKSFEGKYKLNENGVPLNVVGRTGFKGGGNLYNFGPNHASDMLLFSGPDNDGLFKAILITRADCSLAIPGGFIDVNETSASAAIRELSEEALKLSDLDSKRLESQVKLTFQGYVDDPRNTDNAWIETSFFSAHLSKAEFENYAKKIKSENTDDAIAVNVVTLTAEILDNMYASHGMMIRLAINDEQKLEDLSFSSKSKVIHSLKELKLAYAKKIGILGGSFDPFHAGHLDAANNAIKAHGLDCVIFVPAAKNPFKENKPKFSNDERLKRIIETIGVYENLFVLDYELQRGAQQKPSYTIDTLSYLNKEKENSQSLYFIIGGDSLETLHKWEDIENCMSLAHFVPVSRDDLKRDEILKLIHNFPDHIQEKLYRNFVSARTSKISSTEIRAKRV